MLRKVYDTVHGVCGASYFGLACAHYSGIHFLHAVVEIGMPLVTFVLGAFAVFALVKGEGFHD